MDVKYPEITVSLVGVDGNAFSILGQVRKAMRQALVPAEQIKEYMMEATSGDYDHLLQTTMQWVNVK